MHLKCWLCVSYSLCCCCHGSLWVFLKCVSLPEEFLQTGIAESVSTCGNLNGFPHGFATQRTLKASLGLLQELVVEPRHCWFYTKRLQKLSFVVVLCNNAWKRARMKTDIHLPTNDKQARARKPSVLFLLSFLFRATRLDPTSGWQLKPDGLSVWWDCQCSDEPRDIHRACREQHWQPGDKARIPSV